MKKLLLIFSLMVPAWLYSCMPKAVVPTPAVVIEQAHQAFPKAPEAPYIILPTDPKLAPAAPKVKKLGHHPSTARKPSPLLRHVPRHRPPVAQAPVETLPPQQGPICIFPLNMIPNCTPGANQ